MASTLALTYIRQWRKRLKLSLMEIAERVKAQGVKTSHSSLGRIERGLQPYNQRLLEALGHVLGCLPVDLLSRDPSDPEGVWTALDKLTPPQKRQAAAIIGALASADTDD